MADTAARLVDYVLPWGARFFLYMILAIVFLHCELRYILLNINTASLRAKLLANGLVFGVQDLDVGDFCAI